jgi:biopolymer transport protein ExbD
MESDFARRALHGGYGGDLLLSVSRDGIKIGCAMLRKRHRSVRLFSDFNTIQFASVMGMVVFVLLLVFMTMPTDGHGSSVDMPKVSHPVSMPGALREDAMQVAVRRDGMFISEPTG